MRHAIRNRLVESAVLSALICVGLVACGGGDSEPAADTVFTNGKVVTVDGSASVVQAFAVRSGRFAALGNNDDVRRFIGPSTKVVDLGGRTVIPGLSDAHMHNEGGGPGIDLSLARSISELLAQVSAAANTAKPGDVVVSNNDWHEAQLTEQRLPLATELETAAPGVPVVLVRGGHDYILNTSALNKWGITKSTPVPPGGAITKDANGELTGELIDTAKALVTLPPAPPVTTDDFIRTQKKLNAYGIVNVRVPGSYRGDMFSDYKLLKQLRDEKRLTLRYSVLLPGFGVTDPVAFQPESPTAETAIVTVPDAPANFRVPSISPPSEAGRTAVEVNSAVGWLVTSSVFAAFLRMSALSSASSGLTPPVPATTSSESSSIRRDRLAVDRSSGSGTLAVPDQRVTWMVRSCPTFAAMPSRVVRSCSEPLDGPRSCVPAAIAMRRTVIPSRAVGKLRKSGISGFRHSRISYSSDSAN